MRPPPDFAALMRGLAEGSDEAARELFDRYGHHVLRVVRRRLSERLRKRFDSLDFVQDVWASFFSGRPAGRSFDRPEQLVAFLADIACKKVAQQYRRQLRAQKRSVARERSLDSVRGNTALAAREPTPSQHASANEHWQHLAASGPQRQRTIVTLRRQGRTHAEIAAELGLSAKTVQRVLRRLEKG